MGLDKKAQEELHKKIRIARESMGLTIGEASEKLGFKNYQTLSSIEKGVRQVTAQELIQIAHIYKRNLDFFFQEEFNPDPVILWRKNSDMKAHSIQREFHNFLENYSNLENLLGLSRRWKDIQKNYHREDFNREKFALAEKLGSEIHKTLDLGSRPALNLFNVLENKLRFKILHLPLENGMSGASIVDEEIGVGILINAKEVPWRRNFDLAHELFHVITWNVFTPEEIGDGIEKTKPEQYANVFASSLLLPENHIRESVSETVIDKIRRVDIIEIAKDYGVSSEAILWRFVTLKFLKRNQVKKILDDSDFRERDRILRKELILFNKPNKFPKRFVSLACRCLMEGKISRGTFAEYLDIDRTEIDEKLKEEGFLDENYEKIAAA